MKHCSILLLVALANVCMAATPQFPPAVRGYDNRAQRSVAIEKNFAISGGAGDWTVDIKLKDWCEMAIIVVGDISTAKE